MTLGLQLKPERRERGRRRRSSDIAGEVKWKWGWCYCKPLRLELWKFGEGKITLTLTNLYTYTNWYFVIYTHTLSVFCTFSILVRFWYGSGSSLYCNQIEPDRVSHFCLNHNRREKIGCGSGGKLVIGSGTHWARQIAIPNCRLSVTVFRLCSKLTSMKIDYAVSM